MDFICLDGKFLKSDQPSLMAENRGYRYGDGIFETMKVINSEISLPGLHFERLFSSIALLKFEIPALFSAKNLAEEIIQLCKKNKCGRLARVRLSIFRGNGGLFDGAGSLNYLIESWELSESSNKLNENGLVIDIYPDARKSCDKFSNIKSSSFLLYAMAALYSKDHQLNDCLVQNTQERIADATIANIFLVRNNIIITPLLSEGCVAGVMRKWLLQQLKNAGFECEESVVTAENILSAGEIFLTNAIYGLKWVGRMRNSIYTNALTRKIYHEIIQPLWL